MARSTSVMPFTSRARSTSVMPFIPKPLNTRAFPSLDQRRYDTASLEDKMDLTHRDYSIVDKPLTGRKYTKWAPRMAPRESILLASHIIAEFLETAAIEELDCKDVTVAHPREALAYRWACTIFYIYEQTFTHEYNAHLRDGFVQFHGLGNDIDIDAEITKVLGRYMTFHPFLDVKTQRAEARAAGWVFSADYQERAAEASVADHQERAVEAPLPVVECGAVVVEVQRDAEEVNIVSVGWRRRISDLLVSNLVMPVFGFLFSLMHY